jgi:two-component sensor histidine kinase
VQLDTFQGDLCHEIGRAYGCPDGITTDVEHVDVPTDLAIQIALIVNELVTNFVKHVGPPAGVRLSAEKGSALKLAIADKGQGPLRANRSQEWAPPLLTLSLHNLASTRKQSKAHRVTRLS